MRFPVGLSEQAVKSVTLASVVSFLFNDIFCVSFLIDYTII
jgi:hypothetical protein